MLPQTFCLVTSLLSALTVLETRVSCPFRRYHIAASLPFCWLSNVLSSRVGPYISHPHHLGGVPEQAPPCVLDTALSHSTSQLWEDPIVPGPICPHLLDSGCGWDLAHNRSLAKDVFSGSERCPFPDLSASYPAWLMEPEFQSSLLIVLSTPRSGIAQ